MMGSFANPNPQFTNVTLASQ